MSEMSELFKKALMVRDHYRKLNDLNGERRWEPKDYMAGFVGDVGDLSKLVMAKNGLRNGPDDIDAALAHELSDCLWSIFVLADEMGIDLETNYDKNMAELHERIDREITA